MPAHDEKFWGNLEKQITATESAPEKMGHSTLGSAVVMGNEKGTNIVGLGVLQMAASQVENGTSGPIYKQLVDIKQKAQKSAGKSDIAPTKIIVNPAIVQCRELLKSEIKINKANAHKAEITQATNLANDPNHPTIPPDDTKKSESKKPSGNALRERLESNAAFQADLAKLEGLTRPQYEAGLKGVYEQHGMTYLTPDQRAQQSLDSKVRAKSPDERDLIVKIDEYQKMLSVEREMATKQNMTPVLPTIGGDPYSRASLDIKIANAPSDMTPEHREHLQKMQGKLDEVYEVAEKVGVLEPDEDTQTLLQEAFLEAGLNLSAEGERALKQNDSFRQSPKSVDEIAAEEKISQDVGLTQYVENNKDIPQMARTIKNQDSEKVTNTGPKAVVEQAPALQTGAAILTSFSGRQSATQPKVETPQVNEEATQRPKNR